MRNSLAAGLLASASGIAALLGLTCTTLIAQRFSADEYGKIFYLITLSTLIACVASFGLPHALNRLILHTNNRKLLHVLHGKSFLLSLVASALTFAALKIAQQEPIPAPEAYRETSTTTLALAAIAACTAFFLEITAPAANALRALTYSRVLPKAALLTYLITLHFHRRPNPLTIEEIAVAYFLCHATANIFSFYILAPRAIFSNLQAENIWTETKRNGLKIYAGSVTTSLATASAVLMLGMLTKDTSAIAAFSLALNITIPITIITSAIGAAGYRSLSGAKSTPWRLIGTTAIAATITAVLTAGLTPTAVSYFWGDSYTSVVPLTYLVAPAMAMYGIADVLNRIMLARGNSSIILLSSFTVAVTLISMTLLLIPTHAAHGAGYARFATGLVYCALMAAGLAVSYRKPSASQTVDDRTL